jgi:hypothetical protein
MAVRQLPDGRWIAYYQQRGDDGLVRRVERAVDDRARDRAERRALGHGRRSGEVDGERSVG